jgi:hypothetical protein
MVASMSAGYRWLEPCLKTGTWCLPLILILPWLRLILKKGWHAEDYRQTMLSQQSIIHRFAADMYLRWQ